VIAVSPAAPACVQSSFLRRDDRYTLCGILLLTVLTLAGYIGDKWLERNGHELLEQLAWHEPTNGWSH
jgi:hypothetical protein